MRVCENSVRFCGQFSIFLAAVRTGCVLRRLGLSPDALSQSGRTSLKTLAGVAGVLGVKDTSDAR